MASLKKAMIDKIIATNQAKEVLESDSALKEFLQGSKHFELLKRAAQAPAESKQPISQATPLPVSEIKREGAPTHKPIINRLEHNFYSLTKDNLDNLKKINPHLTCSNSGSHNVLGMQNNEKICAYPDRLTIAGESSETIITALKIFKSAYGDANPTINLPAGSSPALKAKWIQAMRDVGYQGDVEKNISIKNSLDNKAPSPEENKQNTQRFT
jgi:hypothetical protein